MSCVGGEAAGNRGRDGGRGTALCVVEGRADVRLNLRFLNIRSAVLSTSVRCGGSGNLAPKRAPDTT